MSILITGMEMPTGSECLILTIYPDGQCFEHVYNGSFGSREERKAFPVPPHGRLIDADKQDAQIEALIERHLHGYTKSTWDFVCKLRDILKRNSTIIEAEEGET